MTAYQNRLKPNSRILMLFPSGIGDVVRNLGIINSIKSAEPSVVIDVSYNKPETEQVLQYNHNVHAAIRLNLESFTIPKYLKYFLKNVWRDLAVINRNKYDYIISTAVNPLRRFIMLLARVKRKIMLKQTGSNSLKEYKILELIGIKLDYSEPLINDQEQLNKISPSQKIAKALSLRRPNIIVNMFCADSPKSNRDWNKWPEAISCLAADYNVILIGHAPFHYKFEYPIAYERTVDLINQTSITELMYLFNQASVILTIDSFPFHLAYALRKPVIGLFGPVDPQTRVPPGMDQKYINIIYHKSDCAPCITYRQIKRCPQKKQPSSCMDLISVKDVLSAVKKIEMVI